MKNEQQKSEFSVILFDTLFGLIIFFSLEPFLGVDNFWHFVFYSFSLIVVVYWWLSFKSADDAFGNEVSDSTVDLILGLLYVVALEYGVIYASQNNIHMALIFFLLITFFDLIWASIWRYVGTWETTDKNNICQMEKELNNTIILNIIFVFIFAILITLSYVLAPMLIVPLFIFCFVMMILMSHHLRIIDLKIF